MLVPQAIYRQDIDWVNESDVIVADVTRISMGVGFEIGWKLRDGGRVVGLCREDRFPKLSNMIKGITEPTFSLHTWQTSDDVTEILTKKLGKVTNHG